MAQAVVVVREDTPGDKRLAAYAAPADPAVSGRELADRIRHFVADRLPDHLVPPFVTVLDRLPLTPNGKVDRAGLPVPDPMAAVSVARGPASPPTRSCSAWSSPMCCACPASASTTTSSPWAGTPCSRSGWSAASAPYWVPRRPWPPSSRTRPCPAWRGS
ncbi:hypothetical protein IHE61_21935 [Streptomyces sp. GKU 257-1]|nr:hypothetical protein [Streptomyces sp. GKU 257-1]